jgi:3-oxoacyl-[acyl-carrier protein] reductase
MDLGLKGKVAVVMASSPGIGQGIATILEQEGCALALCARGRERLEVTASTLRESSCFPVFAMPADISDMASLEEFLNCVFDEYGKIDGGVLRTIT